MSSFDKKYGTSFVVTQIIMELIRAQHEEVHRRIELTRDLASWVHSMIDQKETDDVKIIDDAITDIEAIRDEYEPRIDNADTAMSYIDERIKLEHDIADILQDLYKVITKYDLIDPSGIIEGKASSMGVIKNKEVPR